MTQNNTLPACSCCTYRSPGMVYPMLLCQLRGILVSSAFSCAKFTVKA